MPTYLKEMLYRIAARDLYSFYQQNKAGFLWVAKYWVETDNDRDVNIRSFRAALIFHKNQKRSPGSIKNLSEYVISNPDHIGEFEKTAVVDEDLEELQSYTPDLAMDDALLYESLLAEAQTRWVTHLCRYAVGIALGSTRIGKEQAAGPATAIQYLRTEFAKTFTREAPAVAGVLHDNIAVVSENLDAKLRDEEVEGKYPLGLDHIDRCVTVGKRNLRFLGIVGQSGDGKTTLTNYIVYNWLRQGAHILYCSTEHSPEEIWEFVAFLHQTHPDYSFELPSLLDWENKQVTEDDRNNMARILCDIQDRKNLPGLLDCQQFRDWDSIVDHLNDNHRRHHYDILVVDYIGRLTVPGDPRYRDAAMTEMVHKAQALTRTFDANKGIVLLTPIQVNREGGKGATRAEEGEARYNLTAIKQTSAYDNDLDLCLTVWSDEDMKCGDQVEIQQIKQRKGRRSPIAKMIIDRASGAFRYPGASEPVEKNWSKTPDSVGFTSDEIGI